MASIVWADVVDFAPNLSTFDTDAQTALLAHVNTLLDVSQFGGESGAKLRLARIYLAAHMATLAGNGSIGAAGPVISESAGGLSRAYSNSLNMITSDPDWDATSFGKMYRTLLRSNALLRGPFVI